MKTGVKIDMMKPLAFIILIAFSMGFCLAEDLSQKNDAYREEAYHYMPSGIGDKLFTERWNFCGVSGDTQFLITYLLSDPDNITGLRRIQAIAAVFAGNQSPTIAIQNSRGFGGDKNNPFVSMDQSSFTAQNSSTYMVTGNAKEVTTDKPLSWNLMFNSALSPWYATPIQLPIGHVDSGWMKWLVYMPSARVAGTLTSGGRDLVINGTGYHSHSWGKWELNDPQINWVEVSNPDEEFSLTSCDIYGQKGSTMLGMMYKGKTIKFSSRQAKFSYSTFALDPQTGRTYPVAYEISADNGQCKLDANISVLKSAPLLMSYPWPMPSYIIFEQTAGFNGSLSFKGGETYDFDLTGLSEYATHKLHPIYGTAAEPVLRNTTITATNLRTGQIKRSDIGSDGTFSIDGNFTDYLADSKAPWVANGDEVRLEFRDSLGRLSQFDVNIDLGKDSQEINL